jgi:hypothetical protein
MMHRHRSRPPQSEPMIADAKIQQVWLQRRLKNIPLASGGVADARQFRLNGSTVDRAGLQHNIYDGEEPAFFILQGRLLSGFIMASATPTVITFGLKNMNVLATKYSRFVKHLA